MLDKVWINNSSYYVKRVLAYNEVIGWRLEECTKTEKWDVKVFVFVNFVEFVLFDLVFGWSGKFWVVEGNEEYKWEAKRGEIVN